MDSSEQMKTLDSYVLLGNTDQAWLIALGTRCILFPPQIWQIFFSRLMSAPFQELTKDQRNPCIKVVFSGSKFHSWRTETLFKNGLVCWMKCHLHLCHGLTMPFTVALSPCVSHELLTVSGAGRKQKWFESLVGGLLWIISLRQGLRLCLRDSAISNKSCNHT